MQKLSSGNISASGNCVKTPRHTWAAELTPNASDLKAYTSRPFPTSPVLMGLQFPVLGRQEKLSPAQAAGEDRLQVLHRAAKKVHKQALGFHLMLTLTDCSHTDFNEGFRDHVDGSISSRYCGRPRCRLPMFTWIHGAFLVKSPACPSQAALR